MIYSIFALVSAFRTKLVLSDIPRLELLLASEAFALSGALANLRFIHMKDHAINAARLSGVVCRIQL
jgi:hypothetical protein